VNRAEHIAWVKERALKELEYGDPGTGPTRALASLSSDLRKHPDTADHPAIVLGFQLAMNQHLKTPEHLREWIEGIN